MIRYHTSESTTEYSGAREGGPRDVAYLGDTALVRALGSGPDISPEAKAEFLRRVQTAHLRIEEPLFRDQQPPAATQ